MKALRWLFLGLVLATSASVSSRLWDVLRVDGLSTAEALYLALFALLFTWIAASFWMTFFGAYVRWRGLANNTLVRPSRCDPRLRDSLSHTAILFPVRNEEPDRLFAGIKAVCGSIREYGVSDSFDIFILSDSNTPENIEEERRRVGRLREEIGHNIFYRHRTDNSGRKSGNIAEFCRNWGRRYDYMVVLDADSLMTGETLASLVLLMDANPRAALIQAAPQLVGSESVFGRMQQFASSIYGPVYTAGLAMLQGADGNYWGHNAIIRIEPFMQNCGLPALSGRAPLGGEIMSHDFVEAALLRRAGWDLHMVTDLGGSYEEPPPTLVDYLIRDRRWCQGNLQHMRLIFAHGFRTPSRGHLAAGVMSYLSSPLWLALLVATVAMLVSEPHIKSVTYWGAYPVLAWPESHNADFIVITIATAVLLFAPKLFGLLLVLRDPHSRRAHGGGWKIAASVALETLISAFLAPIMMLSQTAYVIRILLGETKGWGVQRRGEQDLDVWLVARVFAIHTILAIAAGVAIYEFLPDTFWWFVVLLAGPVLAIPLASLTGSIAMGRWVSRLGLFLTPEDAGLIPIVSRVRSDMAAR